MGSLLFQLPVMLLLFAWRQEVATQPAQAAQTSAVRTLPSATAHSTTSEPEHALTPTDSYNLAIDLSTAPRTSFKLTTLLIHVSQRLLRTPPMVAIIAGLLYSAIVREGFNSDVFPTWIDRWVQGLGDCVTPLAAFCLGLFSFGRERAFLKYWQHGLVLLASKVIFLPLLSLGLAYLLGLDGLEGRSAVLIASLPVAIAGFTLTQKYFPDSDKPLQLENRHSDSDSTAFETRHEEYRLLIAGQVCHYGKDSCKC
jgi:predicted permease